MSQLGDQAYLVAVMAWLVESGSSATAAGVLTMSTALPGVLIGPFAGALVDRWPRLAVILAADVARGLAMFVVPAVIWATRTTAPPLPLLYTVALVSGAGTAFFRPAIAAVIPDLVPSTSLPVANSMYQFSVQGTTMLGQVAGGLAYQFVGAPMLMLINGISFLLAGAATSFVRGAEPGRAPHRRAGAGPAVLPRPDNEPAEGRHTFLADTKAGVHYVWRRPGLRNFIIVTALFNFMLMPMLVLLPFYVERQLGVPAAWYGFLLAALSGGSIVGYAIAATIRLSDARRGIVILGLLVGVPFGFTLLGRITTPWPALAVLVVTGVMNGVIGIWVVTLLQSSAPPELRGRVLALMGTMAMALAPLGMALGGLAGDLAGPDIGVVYTLCGLAAFGATALFGASGPSRRFLAGAA